VPTVVPTCWCCRLQLKNLKITWYRDEACDQSLDSEFDDDDDDDDDYEMHSCHLRPPSKRLQCILISDLNFVPDTESDYYFTVSV